MIVEEQAGRDVEGDEHVDAVVFVCRQDEEYTKHVHHPAGAVNVVPPARDVCKWGGGGCLKVRQCWGWGV